MADKERRINERSLENLKLGAIARYQGKIRQNVSILPETLEWLKCSGNASGMIDDLVAAAKNGFLKSNYTHQQMQAEQEQSNSVYKQIEALKSELEQIRQERDRYKEQNHFLEETNSDFIKQKVDWYECLRERPWLEEIVQRLTDEVEQLRSQLAALEQENTKLIDNLVESERLCSVLNQSQELPDYEAARKSALAKLKLGKQAPEYKRATKAMDLLIDELLEQQPPRAPFNLN